MNSQPAVRRVILAIVILLATASSLFLFAPSGTGPAYAQADEQGAKSPAAGLPAVNGTAPVGNRLTADASGIQDANGLDSVEFAYRRIGSDGTTDVDIDGATSRNHAADVCSRTREVQAAILREIPGVWECAAVSSSDLKGIEGTLDVSNRDVPALRAGDFRGLPNVKGLDLGGNDLTELPDGIFDNVSKLQKLDLRGNDLTELPDGVFDNLTQLETLDVGYNDLYRSELPDGVFDNLSQLKTLDLTTNNLPDLPDDVFDNLTGLQELDLSQNDVAELPDGIFDNLTELRVLNLYHNELTGLRDGVFDNLSELRELDLSYNRYTFTELPDGVFDNLVALQRLDLAYNGLAELPPGIFDNLTELRQLDLTFIGMTELPDGIFDNLTSLQKLDLDFNGMTELPDGIFDNLTSLQKLDLDFNGLAELPPGIFDNLTGLLELDLYDNRLRELPPGIFENLTRLQELDLGYNNLTVLPDRVFESITDLQTLRLHENRGSPFTFRPEPEPRGEDAIALTVAQATPFDMEVTLSAAGGTLSSTTVSIAAGRVGSDPVTISPDGGGPVTISVVSAGFRLSANQSTRGIRTRPGSPVTLRFNTPAVGVPTIGGTARVGKTLTADTSTITDADGMTGAVFAYRWLRCCDTEIAGATGATYEPQASDAGTVLKVRVSFTDDAGNAETLTSAETAVVPSWFATLTVGTESSVIPKASGYSTWAMDGTLSPDRFTQDGTKYRVLILAQQSGGLYLGLSAKMDTDFTLSIGDARYEAREGRRPSSVVEDAYWWPTEEFDWSTGDTVEVSLTPASGPDNSLPQLPLAPPTAYFALAPEDHDGVDPFTFRLYFSEDIATDAETLGDHSLDVTGGSVSSAVKVGGSARIWEITIAPDSKSDVTIALPAGMACDVTGAICTADGRQLHNRPEFVVPGTGATAQSANTPATGAPTVSGTAQVGETLKADTTGVADEDGLENVSFSYRWLADDAEISGATGSTYTLADGDEGKAITVQVSFTDDAGNDERLTSWATDAVAGPVPAKPTGLSATASHDQVALTWNGPNDDSIDGYVILRRNREDDAKGEFSILVGNTGSAATTYTDDTVKAKTPYTYRIKAINGHGVSERSRWFHIDTLPVPVPAKPTGLIATASYDQVVLTWDDPQDDSITGYVILRRDRKATAQGEFSELVPNTGTATTTYTDDSVAAETPYTYRIKAINGYGASERSRWFHIDTPAAPEPAGSPEK